MGGVLLPNLEDLLRVVLESICGLLELPGIVCKLF